MSKFGIGIDPGWKNLGFAIVAQYSEGEPIELIHSSTIDSSAHGIVGTCDLIRKLAADHASGDIVASENLYVNIERYVPYNNTFTTEAENITMLIGALTYATDHFLTDNVALHRAIDWKMKMVKALFKWKRFQNPSDKLDKKFSIAAAKAVANVEEIETDHEADAICLASIPFTPAF